MDFGQCLIRPFRNAKMECCGSSLASPKASRGISRVPSGYFGMPEGVLRWQPGFPQSVAKHFKGTIHFGMQKGMLRDQSGFPKALRGVSVRFGIPETSVAVVPWLPQSAARHFKAAIRPFWNVRKNICGGSLASPKRREACQYY